MTWSGSKLKRSRDPVQLRGEASFVADISAGAKSVRFVRSPFASGRILNVELPTEGLVFTALDIKDVKPICPVLNRPDYTFALNPEKKPSTDGSNNKLMNDGQIVNAYVINNMKYGFKASEVNKPFPLVRSNVNGVNNLDMVPILWQVNNVNSYKINNLETSLIIIQ